nr:glycosyltransferase [Ardenticatena sp.]
MRVALVHDWLNQMGGAENVLITLKEIFPEAPVFTSIYDPDAMPPRMREWDIRTSFLNRIPGITRHHQAFLPLYPLAFEQFDFSDFDVVISNKSGFCHGIITPPHTLHLCYCLTPTRYLWNTNTYIAREGIGGWAKRVLPPVLAMLRVWDRLAADRVDRFVSISTAIQHRVHKFYRRDSVVIHPPVETTRFATDAPPGEYDLIVSRLIPYKRIDLAVKAYTQMGKPLVVIGDGRDRAALERIAGPNVRFLGRVSDEELPRWVQGCRAFVFPGEEDFGIAPIEAQAAGRPVVAFAAGGALDTVIEGVTGTFFHEQTPDALAHAVQRLDHMTFDPQRIRQHAAQFDTTAFKSAMRAFVEKAFVEHQAHIHQAGWQTKEVG